MEKMLVKQKVHIMH